MALARATLDPAAPEVRLGHDALFRAVDRLTGARCTRCAHTLCGHEALLAVAMGIGGAPRCLRCFAAGIDSEEAAALRHLRAQLSRRSCFVAAWERADRAEPGCAVAASVSTPAPAPSGG